MNQTLPDPDPSRPPFPAAILAEIDKAHDRYALAIHMHPAGSIDELTRGRLHKLVDARWNAARTWLLLDWDWTVEAPPAHLVALLASYMKDAGNTAEFINFEPYRVPGFLRWALGLNLGLRRIAGRL